MLNMDSQDTNSTKSTMDLLHVFSWSSKIKKEKGLKMFILNSLQDRTTSETKCEQQLDGQEQDRVKGHERGLFTLIL